MIVNAFTLIPNEPSKQLIIKQVESFYLRKKNLRRNVRFHLSLTLCSLKDQVKTRLVQFLSQEGLSLKQINTPIGKLLSEGTQFIVIPIESSEIRLAHLYLLDTLQPFLSENFNPDYLKANLSPQEMKYLHTYGYHRIKEFFRPHITIGKYETTEIRDEELKLAPNITGNLTFDTLQLDEVEDKSRASAKILWETKLE